MAARTDGNALFSKLCIATSNFKHSECSSLELKKILESIKVWTRDRDNRRRLSTENVLQMKGIIAICKDTLTVCTAGKDEQSLTCSVETATEVFRVLRNFCAENANNQNTVASSGVIDQVKDIITILLRPRFQENDASDAEAVQAAIKSGLQLVGNVVVKNEETQVVVWKKCFPNLFLSVFSSTDYPVQDCACMVIYNCLSTSNRLILVRNHDGLKILAQILHLCSDSSKLEWGCFILEYLIKNGFLPDIYQGIAFDPPARIILLDLFQVLLTEALDKAAEELNELDIAEDAWHVSLGYLAEQFEMYAKDVSKLQQLASSADEFFQVLSITRLLKVLATASGLHDDVTGLQKRLSLLETCVELLFETSKPDAQEIFSNVTSIPQGVDSGEMSPTHGFQRDLVRVIANMCYRHLANQNKVRELDGIPLLLDHCNVDDHNPYICQWAIFALRNLLENNSENQKVLSSMDYQGLADTSRLRQFGVEAVELDNGRIKLEPLTRTKEKRPQNESSQRKPT